MYTRSFPKAGPVVVGQHDVEYMATSITDPTITPRKSSVSHGFHGPEPVGLTRVAIPALVPMDDILSQHAIGESVRRQAYPCPARSDTPGKTVIAAGLSSYNHLATPVAIRRLISTPPYPQGILPCVGRLHLREQFHLKVRRVRAIRPHAPTQPRLLRGGVTGTLPPNRP